MRSGMLQKSVPMAVGGLGMITTANYAARRFGVRSAMPGFIGRRLCPQARSMAFGLMSSEEKSMVCGLQILNAQVRLQSLLACSKENKVSVHEIIFSPCPQFAGDMPCACSPVRQAQPEQPSCKVLACAHGLRGGLSCMICSWCSWPPISQSMCGRRRPRARSLRALTPSLRPARWTRPTWTSAATAGSMSSRVRGLLLLVAPLLRAWPGRGISVLLLMAWPGEDEHCWPSEDWAACSGNTPSPSAMSMTCLMVMTEVDEDPAAASVISLVFCAAVTAMCGCGLRRPAVKGAHCVCSCIRLL